MTYLRLLWIHLRLGILNELQYRTNLVIQLIQSSVGLLTALLGLGVVFSKTDSLGGWSAPELLAIVGVYTLVAGITQLVVQPSLARFMEDVRLGTLDFTLTKPVDAQVTIIYSFLLILATCVFWFIRLDNILNIFQSMYEAGKWPIGIYPPWLRTMLTFLVPIGFAITVPAEGLVGRLTSPNLLGALGLAIVLPLVARVFWRFGIRHY